MYIHNSITYNVRCQLKKLTKVNNLWSYSPLLRTWFIIESEIFSTFILLFIIEPILFYYICMYIVHKNINLLFWFLNTSSIIQNCNTIKKTSRKTKFISRFTKKNSEKPMLHLWNLFSYFPHNSTLITMERTCKKQPILILKMDANEYKWAQILINMLTIL